MSESRAAALAVASVLAQDRDAFRVSMAKTLKRTAQHLETKDPEAVFQKSDKVASLAKAARDTFGGDEEQKGANFSVTFNYLKGVAPEDGGPVVDVDVETGR